MPHHYTGGEGMNPSEPSNEDLQHDLNELHAFRQSAMRWGVKPFPIYPERWEYGNGELVKLDLRLVNLSSLKIAFGQE